MCKLRRAITTSTQMYSHYSFLKALAESISSFVGQMIRELQICKNFAERLVSVI
uniref:Uncharacterized protein n=1 Tax=Arundo donax TaxID=35708 RepID=A0A0A9VA75_ARUDO